MKPPTQIELFQKILKSVLMAFPVILGAFGEGGWRPQVANDVAWLCSTQTGQDMELCSDDHSTGLSWMGGAA